MRPRAGSPRPDGPVHKTAKLPGTEADRVELANPLGWLSPGRTLRLPVGYVFLAVAFVIIVAFATYFIGFASGKTYEKAEQQRILATFGPSVSDPTIDTPIVPAVEQTRPEAAVEPRPIPTTTAGRPTERPADPRPAATDRPTRVVGLNYYIVATYPREDADRLITFLADNDILAQAVPVSSGNTAQVWVLRGFTGSELRSEEGRRFKNRLLRLGRHWKSDERGWDNLDTMWPEKYDG